MVGIDDFSRIVSAIYASAITPENWIVAMADVRRTLDAQSAGLLVADGAGRSIKSARSARSTCGFCVPDHTRTRSSATSATAQDGPIEPCIW